MIDLQTIFPEYVANSCQIANVCYNSQAISVDSVFVALKGTKVDGHKYIQNALTNGAKAIICSEVPTNLNNESLVPIIKVADPYSTLAYLSALVNDVQSLSMKTIGITGTDGKTSTATIIANLLKKFALKVGYIGTNGISYNDIAVNLECTTPLAPELSGVLREMEDNKIDVLAMETSSHALATKRVSQIKFDYAIFTNFTHDHLDFHKTMKNYKLAKLGLFKLLNATGVAVINLDDEASADFIKAAQPHKILTYSLKDSKAELFAQNIEYSIKGMQFTLSYDQQSYSVNTNLLAEFNVYNILAAIAVLLDMGYDITKIINELASIEAVVGRMELFYNQNRNISVIVDYAHAPNSIANVISFARKLLPSKVTVITGAVGDGDKSKRSIMGDISTKYADMTIFTTDQPLSEEPETIIKAMLKNVTKTNYQIIIDRETAIKTAIDNADEKEIILVLGKGRETQIKFKNYNIEFCDYEFVKEYLKKL